MESLHLQNDGLETCLEAAIEVIKAGGVVLFPTDTLYALGADALNTEAVDLVRNIKGRDATKRMAVFMSDQNMIEQYVHMTPAAEKLIQTFLPGALTIICKKNKHYLEAIRNHEQSIGGIRIPDHNFARALAEHTQTPITATSANTSGQEPKMHVEDILTQLDEQTKHIDLVIDDGAAPSATPSTVVDLSGNNPTLIREGAISWSDIKEVIAV